LLEYLVEALGLAISLGVICCQEIKFDVKVLCERLPEVGDEERTVIRDDVHWGAMFHDNPSNDEVSKTFGGEHHNGGNEEAHLCKLIHNDEDGVGGRGEGETSDEVHRDGVPRMLGDGEEFKGTIRSVVQWFGMSAYDAGSYI
jgi:hypothetical protein